VRRPILAAAAAAAAVAATAGLAVAVGLVLAPGSGAARPAGAAGAATVPAGQDHDCIVGAPPASVDWSALTNPILSYAAAGVKDQALQWSGGEWHMLFSDMTETGAAPHVRFSVAESSSPDLRNWGSPRIIADDAASPDIVRSPAGTFIVTYQTPQGLAYRTAADASLRSWSAPHSLGRGLARRMIDAALAFTGHGVILGFKAGTTAQHFEIAWAPSLTGTFHLVGRPAIVIYDDTVENYEFLTVDGAWHLVATSNTLDEPFIFTLSPGDPATPTTWLHWSAGQQLSLPSQEFNSGPGVSSVGYEHANSAFLCVGPGGEDYLSYAGSTELTRFGGWGHARIGLARSADLAHWEAPPG
jgi:hypothetical protein